MDITEIETDRLADMERRYVEQGRTEGGPFTLYEIRGELQRRLPSPFDVREVARKIIELATENPGGTTTYGDLWRALLPGQPWQGNHSQQIIGNALGNVIAYCHQNNLPILTPLVVNAGAGALTDEAIANIADQCRRLGMDTRPNDRAFVEGQAGQARGILLANLP
jgi:hypothetical protein